MNNPSQTKDMNELNKKIEKIFKQFYDAGGDSVLIDWKRNDIQKLNKEATKAIQALLAEQVQLGRISERNEVALDNYRGHTFSDSTNWEAKFAKFIDNNEKRLAQLKDTTLLEGIDK